MCSRCPEISVFTPFTFLSLQSFDSLLSSAVQRISKHEKRHLGIVTVTFLQQPWVKRIKKRKRKALWECSTPPRPIIHSTTCKSINTTFICTYTLYIYMYVYLCWGGYVLTCVCWQVGYLAGLCKNHRTLWTHRSWDRKDTKYSESESESCFIAKYVYTGGISHF